MARKKRNSKVIEKANVRSAALESIDSALDLGNGKTLVAYNTKITEAQDALDDYNAKLSEVDSVYNVTLAKDRELATLSDSMLEAVGVKFGKDSNEYEMAGGTRTSERKPPKRKPKPPTP